MRQNLCQIVYFFINSMAQLRLGERSFCFVRLGFRLLGLKQLKLVIMCNCVFHAMGLSYICIYICVYTCVYYMCSMYIYLYLQQVSGD